MGNTASELATGNCFNTLHTCAMPYNSSFGQNPACVQAVCITSDNLVLNVEDATWLTRHVLLGCVS